jgi:hypothetical protein
MKRNSLKIASRLEQDTPLRPRAVAEGVCEEASVWLNEPLPRRWLHELIAEANTVHAHNALPAPKQMRTLQGLPGAPVSESEQLIAACCAHSHEPSAAVASTDAQIDRLVYGLYGLTEEEVRIIEEPRDEAA